MINTYDILINLKEKAYEFYEWYSSDNITHIRKIPTIKVEENLLYDFLNYDCIVSKEFLDTILNKTEMFKKRNTYNIKYSCVLYCNSFAIAFSFNDNGLITGRSKLLYEEEEDIIIEGKDLNSNLIKYKKEKKHIGKNKFTRLETYNINILCKYIDNIYKDKKYDELRFLYFECFEKTCNNYKKIYDVLKQNIQNGSADVINNIKNIIKVTKK